MSAHCRPDFTDGYAPCGLFVGDLWSPLPSRNPLKWRGWHTLTVPPPPRSLSKLHFWSMLVGVCFVPRC